MSKIKLKLIAGILLVSFLTYTLPVYAYTKDETVYSKMKTDGENYKTTVSTHLENTDNQNILEDLSNLLNIQNTSGNEEYKKDGNKIIWQAGGKDIYYQGESEKELPITYKIKYKLDGKEISAEELAGKSGKVSIEINYTNHEEHKVSINGVTTTLYTPFIVVVGAIINNDTNKNITVNNGKIINNGNKTIVVGMATPGMQKSLGLSNNIISLTDTIKITMETKEFELGNIITLLTPKILEKEDLDVFNDLDEIYNKVATLQNTTNKIQEGANSLKDGAKTYYEKSKEFNKGVEQIQQGANSASSEYTKLNEGISTLNSSSNTLNEGAKQISVGTEAVKQNLERISGGVAEIEQGSVSLNNGIKQVQGGITQIQTNVEAMVTKDDTETITQLQNLQNANTTSITQLMQKLAIAMGIPMEQLDINQLRAQISSMPQEVQSTLNLISVLQANNEAISQTINTLTSSKANLANLNNSLKQVENGLNDLTSGAGNLTSGISSLKNGTNTLAVKSSELVNGSKQLYDGTKSLQAGTQELAEGSSKMQNGLYSLKNGTNELLEANNQLTQGAKTLQTGANTLAEGIYTFNKEGITPICNYINGDLKNLVNRAEKLIELSENYQTFTELKDSEKGNVKFIMMTDSIKKRKTDEIK